MTTVPNFSIDAHGCKAEDIQIFSTAVLADADKPGSRDVFWITIRVGGHNSFTLFTNSQQDFREMCTKFNVKPNFEAQ